jgi:hypothetical protein
MNQKYNIRDDACNINNCPVDCRFHPFNESAVWMSKNDNQEQINILPITTT